MRNRSASLRTSAAWSGLVTALSLATVTGLAAVVGLIIAREFGRTAETDGFFAAYGVFIVAVLAATAFRLVVLPPLARAAHEERLAGEFVAYVLSLAVLVVPALVLAIFASDAAAGLLTGDLPPAARATAADALPWMLVAAAGQLYAGLAASALAARDDYSTAAVGYAAGSVAGLALILLRVDPDGIVAVAWGMALNGAVAFGLPLAALIVRRRGWPSQAEPLRLGARLAEFARGVALPLALQGLYLVCLRFAAELGEGEVTSLSFAYLIAAALVAVTASSLGLVSSVPLARGGIDAARAGSHVVSTAWLALTLVAGAAGVFAVAGGDLLEWVLGDAYGGEIGSELGRLVVYLSPWMVASIGVSVTFPLLFVAGRSRALPLLAIGALVLHSALGWAGSELLGLPGIAAALAVSTTLVLSVLLALLGRPALAHVARGLAGAALLVAAVAFVAFLPPALLLSTAAAAAVGLAGYAAVLLLLLPRGLREAWGYVRALH